MRRKTRHVMRPLFPPWSTTVIRVVLALLAGGAGGGILLLLLYKRTPLYTQQSEPVTQPIEFDHRHHVADDGIDCRYCQLSRMRPRPLGP